jgi:hypothetical protein
MWRTMWEPMPTFEVVEVTPTKFQVNELRPTGVVFVGLRETREEAEATVNKLMAEYK